MTPKTDEQLEQCRQAARLGGLAGKGKPKSVNRAFALARSKKALDTRWSAHRLNAIVGKNGWENRDRAKTLYNRSGEVASPNPCPDTLLPLKGREQPPSPLENAPERTQEPPQGVIASQPIHEQPIESPAKPERTQVQLTARERELLEGILNPKKEEVGE